MTKKQVDVKAHDRQGKKVAAHKRAIEEHTAKGLIEQGVPDLEAATKQLAKNFQETPEQDSGFNAADISEKSDEELRERYKEIYEQPYDALTKSTNISWRTDWVTDKRQGETNEEYQRRIEEQTAIEREVVRRYKKEYLNGADITLDEARLLRDESKNLWSTQKDEFHFPLVNGWEWEIKELQEKRENEILEERTKEFQDLRKKIKEKYGSDLLHDKEMDIRPGQLSDEEIEELLRYVGLSHWTGYQRQGVAESSKLHSVVQAALNLQRMRSAEKKRRQSRGYR